MLIIREHASLQRLDVENGRWIERNARRAQAEFVSGSGEPGVNKAELVRPNRTGQMDGPGHYFTKLTKYPCLAG
jgi:hypothetical protein